VEDLQGAPLRSFRSRGKTYVLGEYGERYNVRVVNHSGERVEAVISIDGRDAVSGEIADFKQQRGYIIGPYDSVLISGFRESFENVRGFRFTNPGNSYSARRGTPENVGVIGLAVFRERPRPRPVPLPLRTPRAVPHDEDRRYREGSASSAPAKRAAPSAAAAESADGSGTSAQSYQQDEYAPEPSRNNLGTEYGERLYSPVYEVSFVRARAAKPNWLTQLFYDDEAGLESRGIRVHPPIPVYREPQAFPANRFAPPPPGDY
jgi:hypothetical protein